MASRGINLIGHLGGNLGLGVAARNTAALLDSRGDDFVGVNVVPRHRSGNGRHRPGQPRYWTARAPAPYGVNLFHLNPPEVLNLARTRPPWLSFDGRTSAIVPFWELPNLPEQWRPVIEDIDLVLAPTRFIEQAVRRLRTRCPCRLLPADRLAAGRCSRRSPAMGLRGQRRGLCRQLRPQQRPRAQESAGGDRRIRSRRSPAGPGTAIRGW